MRAPRLVLVDNYDSFTYNLVQLFATLGAAVEVYRNDRIDLPALRALQPDGVLISPGPGDPDRAGISLELAGAAGPWPLLGVCLGHQAIGQAFGGRVVRAPRVMHGKVSPIFHDGRGLFEGLPNPFEATRYHSLLVERSTLPDALEVSAKTWEEEIMGLRHRSRAIDGVQFHPESILTAAGRALCENFLRSVRRGIEDGAAPSGSPP